MAVPGGHAACFSPFIANDPEERHIQHYYTITCMPAFQKNSTEELRLEYYKQAKLFKPADTPWKGTSSPANLDFVPLVGEALTSRIFKVNVGQGRNSKIYQVHEAALLQSPVLRAAITSGKWQESRAGCFNLIADEPHVFERLLEYFYSGDFAPRWIRWFGNEKLMHPHKGIEAGILVKLYCLADKYCVEHMKLKIVQKIKACNPTIDNFLGLVQAAYGGLPERQGFCCFKDWAKDYMRLNHQELSAKKPLQAIIKQGGPLAWDFYMAKPDGPNALGLRWQSSWYYEKAGSGSSTMP